MPASSTSISSGALSASLSLVVLQVVSRLFSFALNQLLLRSTSPHAFGVATIQLDTLIATILFFLREGLRGAVARAGTSDGKINAEAAAVRRQTLLIPTLLTPAALAVCVSFYAFSSPSTRAPPPPQWSSTIFLYSLSVLIELVSEPLYLETLAAWQTLTTKRVKVEGFAIFVKAVATLAAVRFVVPDEADALLAFGIGQLAYSLTIWIGLYRITRNLASSSSPSWRTILPRQQQPSGHYFDQAILETGWALTKQSVIKQLLTEGDKLAVGKFGSEAEMGGYAIALNYGSLIARVVFQPLEESSRLYFSSLAAASSSTTKAKLTKPEKKTPSFDGDDTLPAPPPPPLSALAPCASYLRLVLLLQAHLALIFTFLAPSFTTPLLHLLLGPKWSRTSTAPIILRAYAYSLPFLGLNGITEAFFQAVASPSWIQRGAGWMVVCAGAFAATCWVAVQVFGMGATGLVVANCVNMGLRTAFSTYFMVRYFSNALSRAGTTTALPEDAKEEEEQDRRRRDQISAIRHTLNWRQWTPSLLTLSTFFLGGYACRRSETRWTARVMRGGLSRWEEVAESGRHLGLGAGVGLLCLVSIALSHRQEILLVLERRRATHAKQE